MNKVFFYLHEAIKTAKELSSQTPIFVFKTKEGYILDFEVSDNWVCKVINNIDDVELNLLRFLG